MDCLCDAHPIIRVLIGILTVVNVIALIFSWEKPACDAILRKGPRGATLGQWLGVIVTLPASIVWSSAYFFCFIISKILSWKPIKDDVIR